MNRLLIFLPVVPLVACAEMIAPPRLIYEAHSTISSASPITVETTLTVRNTGGSDALLEANTCGMSIAGFENPRRTGNPVWESIDATTAVCTQELRLVDIAPGDYYDFHFTGSIPASMPAGTYYLAVDMRHRMVPAGQFDK
jgi:hypothetical protein